MAIDWTHPGTWLFILAFLVLPVAVLAWAGWALITERQSNGNPHRSSDDQSAGEPPSPNAS
ncbi:MAG: hypothetical protein RMJ05_03395 [Thermomicrobium sp.]|nr:hypothetical protein [Thermomicrobium sp.]MDW8005742.1 hypothetical protein [Thermomicrobium sp.]